MTEAEQLRRLINELVMRAIDGEIVNQYIGSVDLRPEVTEPELLDEVVPHSEAEIKSEPIEMPHPDALPDDFWKA